MEDKETKTRTTEEKVELLAHSIIAACEVIRELTDGHPNSTKHRRINRAALSAQFHAEGILTPYMDRVQYVKTKLSDNKEKS
jgi:hypothetical protein|tara:strand:- start:8272 stop:8517 length:246 start_codon:yes stop_codon:yes gene_type:complete